MIRLDSAPIALDLETTYQRVTLGVQPRPLGKGKIVGVIVQNTFMNMDGPPLTANNVVVMFGDDSAQPVEILPGALTPVLYVNDLEQIYGRVQSGVTEVAVTLVVYKERR